MVNKKNIYQIEVDQEVSDFINNLKQYENFRYRLRRDGTLVDDEDIIKAAIYHYISEISNFYKNEIIQTKENLPRSNKVKNRFKQIMQEKGLKQQQLSELTGIFKSNLSQILNNKNQPTIDYFLRLWVALEQPKVEDIFYHE